MAAIVWSRAVLRTAGQTCELWHEESDTRGVWEERRGENTRAKPGAKTWSFPLHSNEGKVPLHSFNFKPLIICNWAMSVPWAAEPDWMRSRFKNTVGSKSTGTSAARSTHVLSDTGPAALSTTLDFHSKQVVRRGSRVVRSQLPALAPGSERIVGNWEWTQNHPLSLFLFVQLFLSLLSFFPGNWSCLGLLHLVSAFAFLLVL